MRPMMTTIGIVLLAACGGAGAASDAGLPDADAALDAASLSETPSLPSLEDESSVFRPRLDALVSALAKGNAVAAAETFTAETRQRYKGFFETHAAILPALAEALSNGQLVLVGEHEYGSLDGTTRRIGEVAVTHDGIPFRVTVVKVDGTWMFYSL